MYVPASFTTHTSEPEEVQCTPYRLSQGFNVQTNSFSKWTDLCNRNKSAMVLRGLTCLRNKTDRPMNLFNHFPETNIEMIS